MVNQIKRRNFIRRGFTLIELLIVIVIIGILAVAVLSAINPIEQINKAEDASMRSDANELLNAYERYYTTHMEYPWEQTSPGSNCSVGATADDVASAGCVNQLVTSGELKPEFESRDSVSTSSTTTNDEGVLYVSVTGSKLVHICFVPRSKSLTPDKDAVGNAGTTHICVPE